MNVEDVTAQGGPAGLDIAFLYDSPGDDTLVASASQAKLTGPGYSTLAVGFDYAHAYATPGGHDVATFYDSAGDDSFLGTPVYAKIYGDGYAVRAKHFQAVYAYATAGGHDVGRLFGSAGDDLFVSTSTLLEDVRRRLLVSRQALRGGLRQAGAGGLRPGPGLRHRVGRHGWSPPAAPLGCPAQARRCG